MTRRPRAVSTTWRRVLFALVRHAAAISPLLLISWCLCGVGSASTGARCYGDCDANGEVTEAEVASALFSGTAAAETEVVEAGIIDRSIVRGVEAAFVPDGALLLVWERRDVLSLDEIVGRFFDEWGNPESEELVYLTIRRDGGTDRAWLPTGTETFSWSRIPRE